MVGRRGSLDARTIGDFDDQWSRYTENSGFYASKELFEDIIQPLITPADLRDKSVIDIGSGTGRIVNMLLACGVRRVIAVEPAPRAFEVLRSNTRDNAGQIEYLNIPGEDLPATVAADLVVSIGVIHHIPEPDATVRAAFQALRPGGKCLFWLYGKEGNELYLSLLLPLRRLISRLPHGAVALLSHVLNALLDIYLLICRRVALPLRDYLLNVLGRMSREKRYLVIYDQLKPAYAKYYTRAEAEELLRRAGFIDVRAHHRHGYSWTVAGTKPGIIVTTD
jgi:SAM-dependent methyltransferase